MLKEYNNFSYRWKVEPDIPISFVEILFEKPQFSPPSNLAVYN